MKELLINILEFMLKQLREDKCTAEELKSIHDAVVTNIEVDATIKDIASFYGKSEGNVSTVINRRMSKPKRRVYYNFNWFNKIKPKNWAKLGKISVG